MGVAGKSHLPSEEGPTPPPTHSTPILIGHSEMQLLRNALTFLGIQKTGLIGQAPGRHLGMGKMLQAWVGVRC